MGFLLARIFLIICYFVCSYQFKGEFNKNPELEWDNMAKMTRVAAGPLPKDFRSESSTETSDSEYRMLPDFLVVSSAKDQKALFKPERGARQLPSSVKDILFPTTTTAPSEDLSAPAKIVEILCHIDRIYVRVKRDAFKTLDAYKYLKLGTCPVNQGTQEHYYFLYYLRADCDFKKESNVDDLTVKSVLHYLPTTVVLREMPFDVPVQCKYQRLLHSYKVGIQPKVQRGTLFKSLKRKSVFVLLLQDASGNELTRPYVMGEPMFFEAKRPDGAQSSANDRIYINKCFMTSSQVPTSSPKYTVIDNFGCMIDGKQSAESRFLPGSSKIIQRFTISAVILREMVSSSTTQQLYMHCDISVGKRPPSEGLKACNYDPATRKWNELYGDHRVCSCCDSSCSSEQLPRAFRNMVTSQPWKVDFKEVNEEDDLKMKTFDADFSFEDNAMEMTTDLKDDD